LIYRIIVSALRPFWLRVLAALALLVLAKLASVAVPLALKRVVDVLGRPETVAALPVALLVGYALLRFLTTLFSELRDAIFVKVTQRAVASISQRVFRHLHALSARFHYGRETGGLSRDIDRGTRGIGLLLGSGLFTILPTIIEIAFVVAILLASYDPWFSWIILAAFVAYTSFTLVVTARRAMYRRALNKLDSNASNRTVDSLINFEAVKYFGNERHEAERFRDVVQRLEKTAVRNQISLSVLHVGQSAIIAAGVTAVMLLAGRSVLAGTMTVGDLVLVNAYVIQICLPLNSLGFIYREMKDAVTDVERMVGLLNEPVEVQDAADARPLQVERGEVRFEHVHFGYDDSRRILQDVSFTVPPGATVAVVGGSGAGKSTLSRLLFRLYDPTRGRILIDGQDIRHVTQQSLRAAVGIVPQDTVLFNDTIAYNIGYGRLGAGREAIVEAARAAQLHAFIEHLPEGYDTPVGERGLKISGGEKQRIAIARAILRNPPILVFDEATSALDARSERAIQSELQRLSRNRTTLVVAHRLSTIVDADEILVMDHGRIVERGRHGQLLAVGGLYRQLWMLQQKEAAAHAAEEAVGGARAGRPN
jgi:ATP-binding cassette, subfamily B, bacterial